MTCLDDQTYEYENTMDADAHSNAITELYALINDFKSHTDSKTCYTFLLLCIIILYPS